MIDFDRIGADMRSLPHRQAWKNFVLELAEAAAPGGPLEGWAFHGTSPDRAQWIAIEGMKETEALPDNGPNAGVMSTGTHWATPLVAAFYAEDLILSRDPDIDPMNELVIVAARISDLETCGLLVTDGATVDWPIVDRLAGTEEEIRSRWEASRKQWQDCWKVFGTLLVLGEVPAHHLTMLNGIEDLAALLQEVEPSPSMLLGSA